MSTTMPRARLSSPLSLVERGRGRGSFVIQQDPHPDALRASILPTRGRVKEASAA